MSATGEDEGRRDSRALDPAIITDPVEQAETEARNGLRQYDRGVEMVRDGLERLPFRLRLSMILDLHREALAGLSLYAGNWRPGGVEIEKSEHTPPGAHLVAGLVEELCDYIHLAAYCMWRLNWIHPFADGNGRTSRMLSYVVMSIRAGYVLPGTPTIPYYIVENRIPYFQALDAADASLKEKGDLNLSKMEALLSGLLAKQLTSFYESAGGHIDPPPTSA